MSTRIGVGIGWGLVGLVLGGSACRGDKAPSLDDYRDPPPPPGVSQTLTLGTSGAPVSSPRVSPPRTLEPAADGFARIDELGIEVQLPAPSALRRLGNRFELRVGTCDLMLMRVTDPTHATVVGRFALQCTPSPHCTVGCPVMRAVTGLSSEDMYPREAPAVTVGIGGGMMGGGADGLMLWRDGTVHFTGPRCAPWKPARRKLEATKVTSVLATLEALDFDATPPCEAGPDSFFEYLTLTSVDGRSKSARYFDGCNPHGKVFKHVHDTVGPNPCSAL